MLHRVATSLVGYSNLFAVKKKLKMTASELCSFTAVS